MHRQIHGHWARLTVTLGQTWPTPQLPEMREC